MTVAGRKHGCGAASPRRRSPAALLTSANFARRTEGRQLSYHTESSTAEQVFQDSPKAAIRADLTAPYLFASKGEAGDW